MQFKGPLALAWLCFHLVVKLKKRTDEKKLGQTINLFHEIKNVITLCIVENLLKTNNFSTTRHQKP